MEIRLLEQKDIAEVVELWYETSRKAHDFIPAEYWLANRKNMAEIYLLSKAGFPKSIINSLPRAQKGN
ncbi:MAG: hypothetical protein B6241_08245 [Spirochaetaceae bacterium 4572_59]|nr:MAG: hypothetical protein B6241_08245 [Spirochaetaceae bacterium 4572_59]